EKWVSLIGAVPDLSAAYATADVFLLSSRLDPLPNVTIDAMHEALPVICFEKGNGLADILSEHGLSDACVACGMDTEDMAAKVIALAASEDMRNRIGKQSKSVAESLFNMSSYIARIEEFAVQTVKRTQQEQVDVFTIIKEKITELDYFFSP